MKIITERKAQWNNFDIHFIPVVWIRLSIPLVISTEYKWQYRETAIGFKFICFSAVIQFNIH